MIGARKYNEYKIPRNHSSSLSIPSQTVNHSPPAIMNSNNSHRVLIIGAGSMGIILGYHLSLAGANITFLVRPHRVEQLSRPQNLYCYGDNQLKTFSDFSITTNPSEMIGAGYDYVVVTLDAASLKTEVGQDLVKTIGEAVRGTKTGVIVGAVFPELKSWFLTTSGLSSEQVTIGTLFIHIYPVQRLKMPTQPPTDPKLLAQANFAYIDCLGAGILIEDDSPAVANGFAKLYDASGVSRSKLVTPVQNALNAIPFFAVLAACELLDWPKFRDIQQHAQVWSLAVAALKEIQELSIHGEVGRAASHATTEDSIAQALANMESTMLPFELQTFNRFHHGTKVNVQDRLVLRACLTSGAADGKAMTALAELVKKVDDHQLRAAP